MNNSSLPTISDSNTNKNVVIFNGTNKDDRADPTRVGLLAAQEFSVASPLDHFSKEEVRQLAREFGLPNHSHAASPCLRSRLAYGVRATSENLRRIEAAEKVVKSSLGPLVHVSHNIRVRHMKDNGARIELDPDLLSRPEAIAAVAEEVSRLGFSVVRFSEFRSGSLAVNPKTMTSPRQ